MVSQKKFSVHITRLTPFEYDPRFTDPVQVAVKEQEEYFIEAILAHRGNHNRKSTLEVLVHWLGFDDSHDRCEPWKNLRTTSQLHTY